MQWNLSKVLSFNAGYVDTASFLALHGLFAAHVTGNFVTLGAALISDNHAGAWTKLAALPMFCVVVVCTRLLHTRLQQVGHASYRVLLWCMLLLFALAAGISWFHTPFAPTDSWISFAVGMLLVAAMAIQNALHRIHWLKEPPTTVMTGSTTQLMLDVADWLGSPQGKASEIKARFNRTLPNMLGFALGCAVAALVFHFMPKWVLVMPFFLMVWAYAWKDRYAKT